MRREEGRDAWGPERQSSMSGKERREDGRMKVEKRDKRGVKRKRDDEA